MESFTITVTGKTSELKSVNNVLYYNEQHVIYIPNGVYKFDELKELDGVKNKVKFSVVNVVIKIKSIYQNIELNQKAGLMGRRLTFKTKSDDKVVTDMVDMTIGDNNIYYLNKNEQQKIIFPEGSYEVDDIDRANCSKEYSRF